DQMSKANEQLRRYEELDAKVTRLNEVHQRESMKLDYDKEALLGKMQDLKARGLSFNNVSDLEQEVEKLVNRLEDALTATKRKIREAGM
ncbi:hypothetical protein L0P10_17435, partial [Eggerthella lenta]|nr:hypothetical protein [Eggerthella lenta]